MKLNDVGYNFPYIFHSETNGNNISYVNVTIKKIRLRGKEEIESVFVLPKYEFLIILLTERIKELPV